MKNFSWLILESEVIIMSGRRRPELIKSTERKNTSLSQRLSPAFRSQHIDDTPAEEQLEKAHAADGKIHDFTNREHHNVANRMMTSNYSHEQNLHCWSSGDLTAFAVLFQSIFVFRLLIITWSDTSSHWPTVRQLTSLNSHSGVC